MKTAFVKPNTYERAENSLCLSQIKVNQTRFQQDERRHNGAMCSNS